jgi:2'-hydroxyisoflavone reductase
MSVAEIDGKKIPLPFPLDSHLIYSGERIQQTLGVNYTPFIEGMRQIYDWYHRNINGND